MSNLTHTRKCKHAGKTLNFLEISPWLSLRQVEALKSGQMVLTDDFLFLNLFKLI